MNKFISKSEQDTINFAENFANQLHKKSCQILWGQGRGAVNQGHLQQRKSTERKRKADKRADRTICQNGVAHAESRSERKTQRACNSVEGIHLIA